MLAPAPFLAALVLGGTLAAPLPQGESLAVLVRRLGDRSDQPARYAAYRALAARRDPAVAALLVRALPTFDTTSRSYAFSILQGLPRERCDAALVRLLRSDSPLLRLQSAAMLHRHGRREFERFIAAALADPACEPAERIQMVQRLGGLRAERVLAGVRALLAPGMAPGLERAVLSYLHGVKDRSAAPAVRALLEAPDGSPSLRALAAAWLYSQGAQEQAAILGAALRAGAVDLADFHSIQRYLVTASGLSEELRAALVEVLEKEERTPFLRSTIEIFKAFPSAAAAPSLRRLLEHRDNAVARAALEALATFPGALPPAVLRRLVASEDVERRLRAAEILRRMDDLSGLPAVLAILRSEGAQRAEAARVLGGFRVGAAVAPLLEALEDAEEPVRRQAFNSLRTLLRALFPYHNLDFAGVGYDPRGAPPARRAGAERIRAWWEAHRRR